MAHYHEEIEIVYVIEGEILIIIDSEEVALSRGDICIIMPGQIHSFVSNCYNKVYIMKLFANTDVCEIRLASNKFDKDNDNYFEFKRYIEEIAFEDSSRENGYELAVNILSRQILLFIIRKLEYKKADKLKIKKNNNSIELLNAVNDFLDEHYNEKFSLEDIAKQCGFSKCYFSRYFKGVTKVGFWEYLIVFKLEKAIFIIKNTDENITDIALSCGFNNLRSFNRAFKKYYNCTPKEYRRKGQDYNL